MSFPTSRRACSGLRWGRAAWACGACVLLWLSWPASAGETPSSNAPATPLLASLREADASLTELEALWPRLSEQVTTLGMQLATAQRQLDSLQAALTLWQESSAEWEKLSQDSQGALLTAQTSLDALTARYDALSRSWQDYRQRAERQIAGLERSVRVWRTVAIAGTLGALAAGFLVGLLIP